MAELAVISQDFCSLQELQSQSVRRIDFKSISPWVQAQYSLGPLDSSVMTSYNYSYGFMRRVSPDETRVGNLKITKSITYTGGGSISFGSAFLDMDTNRIINLGNAEMGNVALPQGIPHHAVNLAVGDQRYLRKEVWSTDENRTMMNDLIFGSDLTIKRNVANGRLFITATNNISDVTASIRLDAPSSTITLNAANSGVFIRGNIGIIGTSRLDNFLFFSTGAANAQTRRIAGVRRLTDINEYIGTSYDNDPMTVGDVKAYVFQRGMIMLWGGPTSGNFNTAGLGINNLQGWALCNGQSHTFRNVTTVTPDLRDKFIISAFSYSGSEWQSNITGTLTRTGGSKDAIIVSHNHVATPSITEDGAHTHTISDPGHIHSYDFRKGGSGSGTASSGLGGVEARNTTSRTTGITIQNSGAHSHTVGVGIGFTGESGTNKNLPPFYALAYIIKL